MLFAASTLSQGDIILIEQQLTGPLGEYVPVEWQRHNYDAIVAAVGNGMVVVEAAGNGGQNLDAPAYSTGNGGHYPFLPQNDSGAIIVGAGSPMALDRMEFSCFGSRVNLQGWGHSVFTTGYGEWYSAEGRNLHYTCCFSGTSSASPIVASACILLQANHRARYGVPLTPARVRAALIATGTAQSNPQSGHIGPLPNVPAAIAHIDSQSDCNANGVADPFDIAQGTSNDCNLNGVPDECDLRDGFSTDLNANGILDDCEGVTLLSPADNATDVNPPITLEWSTALARPTYRLVVSKFPDLSAPVVSMTTSATSGSFSPGTLEPGMTYYWSVTTRRGLGTYASTPGVVRFTTAVPPSVCVADFSGDGRVDTLDLVMFLGAFGQTVTPGSLGDTNLDGAVNTVDLVSLLGEFGRANCP